MSNPMSGSRRVVSDEYRIEKLKIENAVLKERLRCKSEESGKWK